MGLCDVDQWPLPKHARNAREDQGCAANASDDSESTEHSRSSLGTAGRPAEGWVWDAPTKSGHIEPSTLKKQHARTLKVSGVRPFVLYALRHTFLTRLGERGCDVWTLARIAGHNSIAISSRYVHPSGDAVLAVMERPGRQEFGHSTEIADPESVVEKLLDS